MNSKSPQSERAGQGWDTREMRQDERFFLDEKIREATSLRGSGGKRNWMLGEGEEEYSSQNWWEKTQIASIN